MTDARVILWGRDIGAVSWSTPRQVGVFQYTPEFSRSRIEVAPLVMPLGDSPYSFPALPRPAFMGLPGLLADALPDRFGHRLIDAWLAAQGRSPDSFDPVQRLCYVGRRGMGALEFEPTIGASGDASRELEIAALVLLANQVLDERSGLSGALNGWDDTDAIEDILRVGTSAGGARAKAVLAWNRETGQFRSGQVDAAAGFEHWLLKFDGISNNRDKELADPQGYGLVEYAYHLMATAAGVEMAECRLHHEGGRSHFMTRRFDRTASGAKLHLQSLAALRHFDYDDAQAYSYEQALQTMRQLALPVEALEQQFVRAVFNVAARNQDDHVKNIAFLMDKRGVWSLSPAFDITYAWAPSGAWTARHQMSINGKRDGFEHADLLELARAAGIKPARAKERIAEIVAAVQRWPQLADQVGITEERAGRIASAHRLTFG